jgi:general secretion pathway protein K
MIDWVDSDSVEEIGGAEDAWYLRMAQPGLAANMPATRIEELGDVRGMNATVLGGLVRYVTALPEDTPLNVNTAPAELLAASLDGLDATALATFVASRVQRPFASVADFRQRLPAGASPIGTDSMYTAKSRYFLVSIIARQGDTVAKARALIDREGDATPRIVWQTIE